MADLRVMPFIDGSNLYHSLKAEFSRTDLRFEKLCEKLAGNRRLVRNYYYNSLGYAVAALQGNLSQSARKRVMADFRSGKVRVLLATNVAARGLDIIGVEQVINYELPDSGELFTHRVGRTGRMGRSGEAVTFITPEDAQKWRQIERTLGRRFAREPWRGSIDDETRETQRGRATLLPLASVQDPDSKIPETSEAASQQSATARAPRYRRFWSSQKSGRRKGW